MNSILDGDNNLANVKKKSLIQRIAIIAATVIVVVCCVIVVVKKREKRNFEQQQQEATYQAEYEGRLQWEKVEAAQRAEEQRLREIEYQRRRDSIATLPKAETPEQPKPTWSWNDIENMVRNLTNEDYYASIWIEEYDTPKWVVIYSKDGKTYFRHFNAEKKTYGAKVRLIEDDAGKYHASGNKRDRYHYQGSQLVHTVNGVEKERFSNHKMIDLFTPEPVPDGYEDWEDYYYDNEEDLRNYYGY